MLRAKWSRVLLAVFTTLLASCRTHGAAECRVFGPIIASGADTRETQNQVAVHNAKGVEVCAWRPPSGGAR